MHLVVWAWGLEEMDGIELVALDDVAAQNGRLVGRGARVREDVRMGTCSRLGRMGTRGGQHRLEGCVYGSWARAHLIRYKRAGEVQLAGDPFDRLRG